MPHFDSHPNAPVISSRLLRAMITIALTLCVVFVPLVVHGEPAGESEQSTYFEFDWWTPRYFLGYSLIAAGLTGYIVGDQMTARTEMRIGPDYDPDNPIEVFNSEEVSKPFRERDTVSIAWVHGFLVGSAFLLAGVEAGQWSRGHGSAHRFHDTLIGYAEATSMTAAITSLAKPWTGRLRPDFGERALRYHCAQPDADYGDHCDGYEDRPLHVTERRARRRLNDGQKSFFSGHASNSFAIFGYTSLVLGGHYVWGSRATSRTRAVGLAAQAVLMTGATFIAASRVTDGRHHTSDVVTGAAVGTVFANFSYWRRFDRSGYLRLGKPSASSVNLQPATEYPGVTLTLRR